MMEHSIIPATLAAIEVVFLFLASLSVKANELPLAFICIIIYSSYGYSGCWTCLIVKEG